MISLLRLNETIASGIGAIGANVFALFAQSLLAGPQSLSGTSSCYLLDGWLIELLVPNQTPSIFFYDQREVVPCPATNLAVTPHSAAHFRTDRTLNGERNPNATPCSRARCNSNSEEPRR